MKTTLYLLLAIAVLLPLGACSDHDDGRNNSLAGLLAYNYSYAEFEIYEGSDLIQKYYGETQIKITKLSDDKIFFYFNWSNELIITINDLIQVYGKPYDVSFDQQIIGKITISGEEYGGVPIVIKGDMKGPGVSTRHSPAYPNWNCNLTFEFAINELFYELNIKKIQY